tara:strand:- start:61 stop:363 length:303 start_codon:yes stop_codon:yes gene_type:complete
MIVSWLIYFFLSFLISFLLTLLVKKRLLKVLIFSFSLALMITVWFKNPGENVIAPIISILILESTILESNGLDRIIRPLVLILFLFTTISFFFWRKKSKN